MNTMPRRVATRYLRKTAVVHKPDRLLPATRKKINDLLRRQGLDGNHRFEKAQHALGPIQDILEQFGIVFEQMIDAHKFSAPFGEMAQGQFYVPLAYKDPTAPDALIPITNAQLTFSFTELQQYRFEVIAYIA